MTNDDFAALRTFARGFLAGSSTATLDESMAYRREAVAVVALRELGVTSGSAKIILQQARHDAYLAVPDCTEFAARLIAAEMIVAVLRQRLALGESELAA